MNTITKRWRLLSAGLLLVLGLTAWAADPDSLQSDSSEASTETARSTGRPLVYTISIDGGIGVVTADYIADAIERAESDRAELLVIQMDTPGGLSSSTQTICKSILNSLVPVAMYISPSGARAGSAGVYITYACHFAAMAHSTNIGAAHPVSGGGEIPDSVMNEKVTNDAVAGIKASADKRGRNAEWAEKAVRESVSITDKEALALNVVDMRATDLDDLLEQIDGCTTELPAGPKTMHLKDPRIEQYEMTFAQMLLNILSDPNIAFLLFSLGGLGIVMELYHPGTIFPGVFGSICLLLGMYTTQVLPINYAGLALIFLSIILFVLEVKVVSYGALTIGGLISLFFGGLMLIDTVDPTLAVSTGLLWTIVLLVAIIVGILAYLVIRTSKTQVFTGNEGMIGKIATVKSEGMVYVEGALWKAVCDTPMTPGAKAKVEAVDSLTLKVKIIEA